MIDGYVLNRLPPEKARDIEDHLARCSSCHLAAAQTRLIVEALRDAAPMLNLKRAPDKSRGGEDL